MSDKPQSFEHHAKMVPMYHYVGFGLLFVPTVYFAVQIFTNFSLQAVMLVSFMVGAVIIAFFARVFPLGVQDRVIRLEERLRMRAVLPEDLRGRIDEVSTEHIIGLRFAPDDELADLTRKALDGSLGDRKAVKQAISNWKPDNQRI